MNLSIITNFGCPFNCSFCITNSQITKKNFKFKNEDFLELESFIENNDIGRLSISGGGEPLFNHSLEIQLFWNKIKEIKEKFNLKVHVHSNLLAPTPNLDFDKYVISINEKNYKLKFKNWTNGNLRFVHVSDGTDIELIKDMLSYLPLNAQFTVKQLDGEPYDNFLEIQELLNRPNCRFLKEGDYNIYFFLDEAKFYNRFKDIKF